MERRQKPKWQQELAAERIEILFSQATKRPEWADRYVFLARKLAMKYNVKIPHELRRRFCHKCYHYFGPSKATVRTNPRTKAVEYTCKNCGHVNRYPYIKEKKLMH